MATPEEVVESLVVESEVSLTLIGGVVRKEATFTRDGEPVKD